MENITSISYNSVSTNIGVPPEYSSSISRLIDQFEPHSVSTSIELYAQFLEFCALEDFKIALAILKAFCRTYDVPSTNIHVV
ncbi:hypothetical protein LPJ68_003321, partial [Coemansia sp. RSA 1086]